MVRLLEEYEDHLIHVKNASDNTVASYMRDLHQFSAFLAETNMDAEQVMRETVCSYVLFLREKGKSSATISRSLASIKSFFNFVISSSY